jgi:hypothetical protein
MGGYEDEEMNPHRTPTPKKKMERFGGGLVPSEEDTIPRDSATGWVSVI